uniref:Uncharacterized protein n=1 Tax=viral metagenome TaxID=1070528 RepID=A0A6H1Z6N1_9ZZZZ
MATLIICAIAMAVVIFIFFLYCIFEVGSRADEAAEKLYRKEMLKRKNLFVNRNPTTKP